MATQHGNKVYFQILLDPARALLLKQKANDTGVRATELAREAIYKWLASTTDSSVIHAAETIDKALWKQSIQNRIEGKRLKKIAAID